MKRKKTKIEKWGLPTARKLTKKLCRNAIRVLSGHIKAGNYKNLSERSEMINRRSYYAFLLKNGGSRGRSAT